MTSASSTSAKNLFADSKMRLADRVQVNINNIASLTRQIQRGSKSSELLTQSARSFAKQDQGFDNSEINLKKMCIIANTYDQQWASIQESSAKLQDINWQVQNLIHLK